MIKKEVIESFSFTSRICSLPRREQTLIIVTSVIVTPLIVTSVIVTPIIVTLLWLHHFVFFSPRTGVISIIGFRRITSTHKLSSFVGI